MNYIMFVLILTQSLCSSEYLDKNISDFGLKISQLEFKVLGSYSASKNEENITIKVEITNKSQNDVPFGLYSDAMQHIILTKDGEILKRRNTGALGEPVKKIVTVKANEVIVIELTADINDNYDLESGKYSIILIYDMRLDDQFNHSEKDIEAQKIDWVKWIPDIELNYQ